MPSYFPENNDALPTDNAQRSLQKIVDLGSGSGVGALTIYSGAYADPNGNVTPANPLYSALYYQTPTVTPYNVWFWDIATAVWIQFSAP